MKEAVLKRITSIDVLRGIVMVIMALDHVRDYFHFGSFFVDPTDMNTTTPILFFTRFITHFCAPVFIFLAGTAAFLYGSKKTKLELFKFLFTRGLWLIFLEFTLNNFIWTFDLSYSFPVSQVIWAIGFSMLCLAPLIYIPRKLILLIGVVIVSGHNLLDGVIVEGSSVSSIIWYLLHQNKFLPINDSFAFYFYYPVIPWIGLILLGYCFGALYHKDYNAETRKKWLLRLGIGSLGLFFVLRGINVYGDLVPWSIQKDLSYTVLSFFNITKYPPSLIFLLMTMGPSLLLLHLLESKKNRITNFFLVFGKVPLFYYFLHVFVIHLLAMIIHVLLGGYWKDLILTGASFMNATLSTYGYPLWIVYIAWISIVLLLYPICKKYMIYKANNRSKWWLKYL
ncbi:MAG: heparan-alpha-glucosaminide N-acetyltransferase domain-containing protein [Cellulophaga sp.]